LCAPRTWTSRTTTGLPSPWPARGSPLTCARRSAIPCPVFRAQPHVSATGFRVRGTDVEVEVLTRWSAGSAAVQSRYRPRGCRDSSAISRLPHRETQPGPCSALRRPGERSRPGGLRCTSSSWPRAADPLACPRPQGSRPGQRAARVLLSELPGKSPWPGKRFHATARPGLVPPAVRSSVWMRSWSPISAASALADRQHYACARAWCARITTPVHQLHELAWREDTDTVVLAQDEQIAIPVRMMSACPATAVSKTLSSSRSRHTGRDRALGRTLSVMPRPGRPSQIAPQDRRQTDGHGCSYVRQSITGMALPQGVPWQVHRRLLPKCAELGATAPPTNSDHRRGVTAFSSAALSTIYGDTRQPQQARRCRPGAVSKLTVAVAAPALDAAVHKRARVHVTCGDGLDAAREAGYRNRHVLVVVVPFRADPRRCSPALDAAFTSAHVCTSPAKMAWTPLVRRLPQQARCSWSRSRFQADRCRCSPSTGRRRSQARTCDTHLRRWPGRRS